VAERLGNTPTVCRACYIHPAVLEAYERGRSIEEFRPRRARRRIQRQQPEYTVEELALLKLLRTRKNGSA
jgi:DNA topoisomerase-1